MADASTVNNDPEQEVEDDVDAATGGDHVDIAAALGETVPFDSLDEATHAFDRAMGSSPTIPLADGRILTAAGCFRMAKAEIDGEEHRLLLFSFDPEKLRSEGDGSSDPSRLDAADGIYVIRARSGKSRMDWVQRTISEVTDNITYRNLKSTTLYRAADDMWLSDCVSHRLFPAEDEQDAVADGVTEAPPKKAEPDTETEAAETEEPKYWLKLYTSAKPSEAFTDVDSDYVRVLSLGSEQGKFTEADARAEVAADFFERAKRVAADQDPLTAKERVAPRQLAVRSLQRALNNMREYFTGSGPIRWTTDALKLGIKAIGGPLSWLNVAIDKTLDWAGTTFDRKTDLFDSRGWEKEKTEDIDGLYANGLNEDDPNWDNDGRIVPVPERQVKAGAVRKLELLDYKQAGIFRNWANPPRKSDDPQWEAFWLMMSPGALPGTIVRRRPNGMMQFDSPIGVSILMKEDVAHRGDGHGPTVAYIRYVPSMRQPNAERIPSRIKDQLSKSAALRVEIGENGFVTKPIAAKQFIKELQSITAAEPASPADSPQPQISPKSDATPMSGPLDRLLKNLSLRLTIEDGDPPALSPEGTAKTAPAPAKDKTVKGPTAPI